MKTPIPPFEKQFSDLAGEAALKFSFARSTGQVFGFLYAHGQPLSLDDVAEALELSKGSASMTLRTLEGWGAVKKVFVEGSRRAHFVAEEDLEALLFRRVEEGLKSRLAWAKARIGGLKPGGNGGSKRLEALERVLRRGEKAVGLLPKLKFLAQLSGGH